MPFACRLIAGSLLALALQGAPAVAQYPNKPITVIVPSVMGGPTDVVTRAWSATICRARWARRSWSRISAAPAAPWA